MADSLSLRSFLDLGATEAAPDHSTLSRTRRLIDVETHVSVFTWVLERLVDAGLVRGKTVGIEWKSPRDPDAKIAKMKDGRTHLAHKAEHGVDMDTGAIVSVTVEEASEGDTVTLPATLIMAAEQVELVQPDGPGVEAVVADKGYHSDATLVALGAVGVRSHRAQRTDFFHGLSGPRMRIRPSVPSRSRTADAARVAIPLLIAFAAPSSLVVERDRPSQFPILGNGPPGTFVLFPGRLRVSLPTDQVVSADDTGGYAKVGFGGMRFTGMTSGRLVFVRERDLYPVGQLSPDRSHTMRLEPQWVASIFAYGQLLWPAVPREP